jgi:hypothetical protein
MRDQFQIADKKTYQAPTLRVYGDIRAVTQSAMMTGTLDGGVNGMGVPQKTA